MGSFMHKTTRQAVHEAIRRAINDLYVLAKEADSEDAKHIYEIIERLKRFNEEDEKKTSI
jgi:DNA polymerase III delta prime subunit